MFFFFCIIHFICCFQRTEKSMNSIFYKVLEIVKISYMSIHMYSKLCSLFDLIDLNGEWYRRKSMPCSLKQSTLTMKTIWREHSGLSTPMTTVKLVTMNLSMLGVNIWWPTMKAFHPDICLVHLFKYRQIVYCRRIPKRIIDSVSYVLISWFPV